MPSNLYWLFFSSPLVPHFFYHLFTWNLAASLDVAAAASLRSSLSLCTSFITVDGTNRLSRCVNVTLLWHITVNVTSVWIMLPCAPHDPYSGWRGRYPAPHLASPPRWGTSTKRPTSDAPSSPFLFTSQALRHKQDPRCLHEDAYGWLRSTQTPSQWTRYNAWTLHCYIVPFFGVVK